MKRVFLIVLDSFGVGEMPDAEKFNDYNCNTLKRISASKEFNTPNLIQLGLSNIEGIDFLGNNEEPKAAFGKMAELSQGKDTTIGHWEIAGIISNSPMPTFPNGFPKEVLDEFSQKTGRSVLCNKAYSGTKVIIDYGKKHIESGDLIVYTSADSVFQIAAHEEIVPIETLYQYCRDAREILKGEYAVGRVIARPFAGEYPNFKRTANRHDFSLVPPQKNMLDAITESNKEVYAIGKIYDIFAGKGITKHVFTHSNEEGMTIAQNALNEEFEGLCFINLVDFDSMYGHRQDTDGYACAISEFDSWLPNFLENMKKDDVLIITADHGCDPGDQSTDHTREYTPLIVYGDNIKPENLGIRETFSDIAATVCEYLDVDYKCKGKSFLKKIIKKENNMTEKELCFLAIKAMNNAYAPYSNYKVGAALLSKSGKVYLGCNIENASYTPTNCAERTAFFKAISEGERSFEMIAVVGSNNGEISNNCSPCGVCRQVMAEFCSPDFRILIVKNEEEFENYTLSQILPFSFKL